MSRSRYILQGTADNFQQLVIENSRKGLVLVDFWSAAAGPSLRQKGVLEALANEFDGRFLLVTVNTDSEKALVQKLGVVNLPSLKLYRHGKVEEEYRGFQGETAYRGIVEARLSPVAGPVEQAALMALSQDDADRALQILADGAVEQPDNMALPLLMAKILIRLGRHGDAFQLLSALPPEHLREPQVRNLRAHLDLILCSQQEALSPDALQAAVEQAPEDVALRFRLAAAMLVGDQYEAVIQHLLHTVRCDAGWQEKRAVNALHALFDLLGGEHEYVAAYRGELFRLLH